MSANSYSGQNYGVLPTRLRVQRGLAFGMIILGALVAFEIFNFSTTEYALHDLLGDLTFWGVSWATILAIAFCAIDFAGIARLHTPEAGSGQPNETWYLFGAWILAATMNAMLTWWGVSLAIVHQNTLGNEVIERQTLLRVVPIFVAVLVWLIRVLIIGTYSLAGNRLLSQREYRGYNRYYPNQGQAKLGTSRALGAPANRGVASNAFQSAARHSGASFDSGYAPHVDPVYAPPYAPPYNPPPPRITPRNQGANAQRSGGYRKN